MENRCTCSMQIYAMEASRQCSYCERVQAEKRVIAALRALPESVQREMVTDLAGEDMSAGNTAKTPLPSSSPSVKPKESQ